MCRQEGETVYGEAWDRDLEVYLDAICSWRADAIVTLTDRHEFDLLNVPILGEHVSARGIRWRHMPIVDVSVLDPDFEENWAVEGDILRRRLKAGARY